MTDSRSKLRGLARALTIARAALGSGDISLAASAARVASVSGAPREKVTSAALRVLAEALEKLGRPAEPLATAQSSTERRVQSTNDACATIEADIRTGKVDLAYVPEQKDEVGCVEDFTL